MSFERRHLLLIVHRGVAQWVVRAHSGRQLRLLLECLADLASYFIEFRRGSGRVGLRPVDFVRALGLVLLALDLGACLPLDHEMARALRLRLEQLEEDVRRLDEVLQVRDGMLRLLVVLQQDHAHLAILQYVEDIALEDARGAFHFVAAVPIHGVDGHKQFLVRPHGHVQTSRPAGDLLFVHHDHFGVLFYQCLNVMENANLGKESLMILKDRSRAGSLPRLFP